MKAIINDVDALAAIAPVNLSTYLRFTGWHMVQQWGTNGYLWSYPSVENSALELLIPSDNSVVDYVRRLMEVLSTLETKEERSQLEIYKDIVTATADVVRIRAVNGSTHDGTFSLDGGVNLIGASKSLLEAAACSLVSPRPVYQSRKPDKVNQFLEMQRIGQTEHGSYTVTLISPVAPELTPAEGETLFEMEEPFERKVLKLLNSSLHALKVATVEAMQNGSMQPFETVVTQGVSANLCEAIVAMGGGDAQDSNVSIGITWSRARLGPNTQPNVVSFNHDTYPVIAEAARVFRDTSTIESVDIEGEVVRLDRDPGDTVKNVKVLANVNGVYRRVILKVSGLDHAQFVRAYEHELPIRCVGDLVKEGRSYELLNYRGIEVIEE